MMESKAPDIMVESMDEGTRSMANLVEIKQEPGIKLESISVDFTHPIISWNEFFQPKIEKIEPNDSNGDVNMDEPSGIFDPVDRFEDLDPVNSNETPEVELQSPIEPSLNHANEVSHMGNRPTEVNPIMANEFEEGYSGNRGEQIVPALELHEMATEANVEMPSTSANTNGNRSTSTSKAKQHKCTVCGYVASCASILQANTRTHTGERPFACESCPKRFAQKSNLIRHRTLHVTEDPFECLICWQIFATRSDLLIHKLRCKRRYECHLCKKYSNSKIYELKMHMRVHSGVRPFQCEQCLMKFIYSHSLKRHLKTHINPPPLKYRCSVCAQNFVQQSVRDEHQMNCKRRRWECYVCQSYVTNHKANLQLHMRMKHTGERPFKCAFCEKCYPMKSNLSWHKKKRHNQ